MAFTYVPNTDIGRVRFRIGDDTQGAGVKPDGSNFDDETIQALIESHGGVEGAVSALLRSLQVRWAGVSDITMGPRTEKLSQVRSAYGSIDVGGGDDGGTSDGGSSQGSTIVPVVGTW